MTPMHLAPITSELQQRRLQPHWARKKSSSIDFKGFNFGLQIIPELFTIYMAQPTKANLLLDVMYHLSHDLAVGCYINHRLHLATKFVGLFSTMFSVALNIKSGLSVAAHRNVIYLEIHHNLRSSRLAVTEDVSCI
jgi:hypothetical protein